MEILIVTGLSGAGKSKACSYLEDTGFYIVDNLPAEMLLKFAEFCVAATGRYERVALVYDIRAGQDFEQFLQVLEQLKTMPCKSHMLYMDASAEVLIKRYKETRRLHPLVSEEVSLEQAIRIEREKLLPVREKADYVINTSYLSTAQLRSELLQLFDTDGIKGGLAVNVMSFGFKHGIPLEADLVLDVRFMPNPYYIQDLRDKTGMDEDVYNYVFNFRQTRDFMAKLEDMVSFLLPLYSEEGKTMLVIAIGCTGGHHRSVAVARTLSRMIADRGYSVTEDHRDITR